MLRVLSLTALILAAAPAPAQNPPLASPANPTVPVAPSPPPEKIAPPSGDMSGKLLSRKG